MSVHTVHSQDVPISTGSHLVDRAGNRKDSDKVSGSKRKRDIESEVISVQYSYSKRRKTVHRLSECDAVDAIYNLMDDVHDSNPSLCSKTQQKAIKKLMLNNKEDIVREYKRLIWRHGGDAQYKIIKGLLEFVE